MDQAEVVAQVDEYLRDAAPLDEVAPDGGPVALRARRPRAAIGREPVTARQFREEVEGLGHGAPAGMDDQIDRSAPWTLLTKVETSCDRILIAGGANVEAEWEQGPAV